MEFLIRRLGPGDEQILDILALEDEDFDLDDRGAPRELLSPAAAHDYLADPHVVHWVAERSGIVLGHLYGHVLRKRAGAPAEMILYEIGVRSAQRRHGIGRALVETFHAWMAEQKIEESWVLADNPSAVDFYEACGFAIAEQPTYLTRG
jgi:ribosomal protein S18 acetylase RimI-like enzyme